jgi:hypothetical protein
MEEQKRNQPRESFKRTDSHVPLRVYRESWSINGEVCIVGLLPPVSGGARLAHCLAWLLRAFASRCRSVYKGTEVLLFTYTGARTATTLVWALSLWFDLALQDPRLIRHHVRSRGGKPTACHWPRLWLEGATYDCMGAGSVPAPPGEVKHKLVVLAEERQIIVSPYRGAESTTAC